MAIGWQIYNISKAIVTLTNAGIYIEIPKQSIFRSSSISKAPRNEQISCSCLQIFSKTFLYQ